MMRSLFLVLVLAGCALPGQQPLTIEQQMVVSCRGYAGTIRAMTSFKSTMTIDQVRFVDETNAIVRPTCEAFFAGIEGASTDLLKMVNDNLRRMVILEQQRKGG